MTNPWSFYNNLALSHKHCITLQVKCLVIKIRSLEYAQWHKKIPVGLAKPQDSTPTGVNSPRKPRTFRLNQASNSSNDANFMASWQMNTFGVTQHPDGEAYHLQVPQETPTSPRHM